jgi:hypothetical protein
MRCDLELGDFDDTKTTAVDIHVRDVRRIKRVKARWTGACYTALGALQV